MDTHFEAINWGLGEIGWFQRATGDLAETLLDNARTADPGLLSLGSRASSASATGSTARLSAGAICRSSPMSPPRIVHGQRARAGSRLAAWFTERHEASVGSPDRRPRPRAFDRATSNVPDLVAQGLFKREYRDHRLEWMIKSGGLDVVLKGLEADNIRFTDTFA